MRLVVGGVGELVPSSRGRDGAAGELDVAHLPPPVLPVREDPSHRTRCPTASYRRAFDLARLLDHPVYDGVYLALGEELGAPLVTADVQFVHASREASGRVHLLGSGSGPR